MAEPRQVSVSGSAPGLNGRLTAGGLGSCYVRVEEITEEVRISSEEAQSAQSKTFYPRQFSQGGFTLTLMHTGYADREKFNRWMRKYLEGASRGRYGIMLISVPARRFTRKAVPQGTLTYGDQKDEQGLVYRSRMSFVGASDPAARSSLSRFQNTNDPDAKFFYPAGEQRSGAAKLEELLFDVAPSAGAIGGSIANDIPDGPSPGPGAPTDPFGITGGG